MDKKKILFIPTGGHPVHLAFAKKIGADILPVGAQISKNYEYYVSEGDYVSLFKLRLLGKVPKNSKLIALFSDPRLFYLNQSVNYDAATDRLRRRPLFKRILSRLMINRLDGALVVGKFEEELFKKANLKIPREVVYPFISKARVSQLKKINPKLNNDSMLFIANGPDWHYKGIDMLINVFKKAKKRLPELKLTIVGGWKVKKEWLVDDVDFVGKKDDLVKTFLNSSLYVHLGRGEAFGVTVLEAMISGIPALVSNLTGAREIVSEADRNFVVKLNDDQIVDKIVSYFKLKPSERKIIGNKFRNASMKMKEEEVLDHFKRKFDELIKKIK